MPNLTDSFSSSRRDFFKRSTLGLGAIALSSLTDPLGASSTLLKPASHPLPEGHFPAKAKRVIYLFQSGG
ncbi:MAG: hypothetical protein KC438_16665, partial [Thermomicrobiales bacterium]|nr:hypothetical protein [Thermomicrobiales bacterium]